MIRHLTSADYRTMPWANGRGVTVEMLRVEENGVLKWRLSRASVVEEGDFSIFPGIERNLTVITGPGFDLLGADGVLPARPLMPVAFAGDAAIRAVGVTAPSDDFNVMTARNMALPQVQVVRDYTSFAVDGEVAVFALGSAKVGGIKMQQYDLILTDQPVAVDPDEPVIVVSMGRYRVCCV